MAPFVYQLIYILAVGIIASIFAFFIAKDAKKFLRGENNLSKINNTIIYTLSYINENMLDNGRFVYANNIRSKRVPPNKIYNITNHADMLYSLYLCEKALNLPGLDARRATSVKYLLDNYVKNIGFKKYAVVSLPEEENLKCEKAKLSATARAVIALSDANTSKMVSDDIFEGFGNFLLFMQKRNGQFYTSYDPYNFELEDDKTNLNYNGDAVLGLLYMFEFNKKQKWIDGAKKGLLFLAKIRSNLKNLRFDYSSIIATEKLFKMPNNGFAEQEKEILKLHVVKMAEQVLNKQIVDKNDKYFGALSDNVKPKDIACMIEGLISVFNFIDDDMLKVRIMRFIDMAMKFLRIAQIQKGRHKGAFPNSADWREYGAPKGAAIANLDTAQHVLTACVRFQNMFTR